jgi:hypothetical protein
MSHRCPVNDCATVVDTDKLMCPPHWSMVPMVLQAEVYRTYRDMPLSDEHVMAMEDAIDAVNIKLQEEKML